MPNFTAALNHASLLLQRCLHLGEKTPNTQLRPLLEKSRREGNHRISIPNRS